MCPSFNAALAYQYTSKFVILDWLCDSRKSKQVLSCEKYMAIHNFARERGVLGGCFVFVCDGAIGNMAFEKVIHLIVAAGGKSVNALSIKDCDTFRSHIPTPLGTLYLHTQPLLRFYTGTTSL